MEDESEVLWVEGVTTSDDKLAIHILLAGEVRHHMKRAAVRTLLLNRCRPGGNPGASGWFL